MLTTRLLSFPELDGFERRMRRMLAETGISPPLPPTDSYETETEYVVELEVPGFDAKEVELEITDHTLIVKGKRAEMKEEKEKTFHFHERLERQFERRFFLPAEADVEHLSAQFAKGVLEVHAPKPKAPKPRKVPIKAKA
jgi:HSP20 family protein